MKWSCTIWDGGQALGLRRPRRPPADITLHPTRRAGSPPQAKGLPPKVTSTVLVVAVGALFAAIAVAGPKPLPSYGLPVGAVPPAAEGVRIEEILGRKADLNLTFVDEAGRTVALKDYFQKGRPVILNLVYYSCPMLCSLILNGQTQVMREIPWTPGQEYEIVTISIDPTEKPELAREKKKVHLDSYGRPAPGWHFLTDHEGNAKKLAELVGFHYRYDERQKQYAHPAAIMILSPEGKISRYLYGIRYHARDVRFALAEASENRTTMAIDKLMLLCYQYDPKANSYVMFAQNFMRLGGILTVLAIALFILRLRHYEKHEKPAFVGPGFQPAAGFLAGDGALLVGGPRRAEARRRAESPAPQGLPKGKD
jgi:protein SCO1